MKEEGLPWSTEELELLFDGLDSDSQGYLTVQEFIAGLSMHQFHMLHNRADCANVKVVRPIFRAEVLIIMSFTMYKWIMHFSQTISPQLRIIVYLLHC